MRLPTLLAALTATVWSSAAYAQDSTAVTACDSLIATRRIDAASGAAREAPKEAGCRRIPRSQIGTVEQRAMIGGAPYECMTVAGGGRCLWVVP
jgi:hypothetical protein